MSETFFLEYSDDYRQGPKLIVSEKGKDKISLKITDKFNVYLYWVESRQNKLLAEFPTYDDAYKFCKYQYFLENEEGPFIQSGHSGSYNPTGYRDEVTIPLGMKKMFKLSSDTTAFFLIHHSYNQLKTFSLRTDSVWK